MKLLVILVLFFCLVCVCKSDKILIVSPTPSANHNKLIRPLLMGLIERAHDVTLVTPFKEKLHPLKAKYYREILLEGFLETSKGK